MNINTQTTTPTSPLLQQVEEQTAMAETSALSDGHMAQRRYRVVEITLSPATRVCLGIASVVTVIFGAVLTYVGFSQDPTTSETQTDNRPPAIIGPVMLAGGIGMGISACRCTFSSRLLVPVHYPEDP
jgi:hypothetical protein